MISRVALPNLLPLLPPTTAGHAPLSPFLIVVTRSANIPQFVVSDPNSPCPCPSCFTHSQVLWAGYRKFRLLYQKAPRTIGAFQMGRTQSKPGLSPLSFSLSSHTLPSCIFSLVGGAIRGKGRRGWMGGGECPRFRVLIPLGLSVPTHSSCRNELISPPPTGFAYSGHFL